MEEKIMNTLTITINELFNRFWDEDLTEEQEDSIDDKATLLIKEFGWDAVFNEVLTYLTEKCNTPESSINAAHIFWQLGWYSNPIPQAYKFLSFFYYCIDFDTEKYDSGDILDSLTTTILPAQGYTAADLMKNPYYMPESDAEMISAVEQWKKRSE